MTKYKITLTLTIKEAFALFAKLLPIEHVQVEEIGGEAELRHSSKLSEYLKPIQSVSDAKRRKRSKRPSAIPFNPDKGINKILLDILANGPIRAMELKASLKASGYSPNSAGSRLQALRERGVVIQHGDGIWSLPMPSASRSEADVKTV